MRENKEKDMRRMRLIVLLLTVASLLVLPGQSASAEDPPRVDRLHALVTGTTDPVDTTHQLGVNRVSGESEFDELEIPGELECDDMEVVRFSVRQPPGHSVRFRADDDVTDGFGEVNPTDDDRAFRDDNATAVRVGGLPAEAVVEIRILSGRFHRVLNYVDVDLRLDVRVVQGGVEICEDPDHEIRITFLIVAPDPDGQGFTLVGVARTHELPEDRTSVARAVCENVPGAWHDALRTVDTLNGGREREINAFEPTARASIRIDGDHRSVHVVVAGQREGRDGFEPCRTPTE
jgi:hypothetical protein